MGGEWKGNVLMEFWPPTALARYYRVGEETKDLFDVGGALKGIYEAELRSCELISESIPAVSFVEFSPDGSRICWK